MDKDNQKKTHWIKPRHRIVRNILNVVLYPYTKIKYGITIERFHNPNNRAYLILYNHQTPFDQFFIGMSFKGAVYYLATEDIFSNGFISSIIRYLAAPIPIKKQTTDLGAIKKCIQIAKEGGTIAIAPEGNRTYSGRTESMRPAIAQLAKKLGLPIVLYRIEGGYGTQPRWSDVIRKGKMRAFVSCVIEPEEYALLSSDQLFSRIKDGLYVDEAKADSTFTHKRSAEYIERLLYVCPFCGLSAFESYGTHFRCKKCQHAFVYKNSKEIEGVGFDAPFQFVAEWYDYQNNFILTLDLLKYEAAPIYTDCIRLSKVLVGKRKEVVCKNGESRLYGSKITIDGGTMPSLHMAFDDISAMAVLGRNKLCIYYGADIYQIKGSKRFNAVKYVNIFYCYKNTKHGGNDGKFLGL